MSADEEPLPLDEQVEAHCAQIHKAMSIVECCKLASASLYEQDRPESMVPAFEAVYELLGTVAGELGDIADSFKARTPVRPRRKRASPRSKIRRAPTTSSSRNSRQESRRGA